MLELFEFGFVIEKYEFRLELVMENVFFEIIDELVELYEFMLVIEKFEFKLEFVLENVLVFWYFCFLVGFFFND